MPENCKYEGEIKRLVRVLDGNGQGGLVKDITEVKTKIDVMCVNISDLKEIAEANAKGLSAFRQYQNEQELLENYKKEEQGHKRKLIYFVIAQIIVVLGLILGIILK